jgi:hypothetical protein
MSFPKNPLDRISRVDGSFHPDQGTRDLYDVNERNKRNQQSLQQMQEVMNRNRESMERKVFDGNQHVDPGGLGTGSAVARVFGVVFTIAVFGFFLVVAYHLFLHR